jgi:A/G-specific adenine glycosylase
MAFRASIGYVMALRSASDFSHPARNGGLPKMARAKPIELLPAQPTTRQTRAISERLLQWYDAEKRDMPWRRSHDPYAILVSEFMLQQTQVATATPYFERFMAEFPTVRSLADAAEERVLRAWAGLGYYSRAQNLHASAQRIVRDYGGRVPETFADLLFLPGVGRYVAGAVASIAFGAVVPALDANAIRVFCRLFALAVDGASVSVRRKLENLVGRVIPPTRPGDFNQAIMELGARICTARGPKCPECPVRTQCRAAKLGNPLEYPQAKETRAPVAVEEFCAVVGFEGRYLIAKCPSEGGRYRNMWEFPSVVANTDESIDPKKTLAKAVKEKTGVIVRVGEEWATIQHQVTHHNIRKRVFRCTPARPVLDPSPSPDVRWATVAEIGELPMGAPHKKIVRLLGEDRDFFGL